MVRQLTFSVTALLFAFAAAFTPAPSSSASRIRIHHPTSTSRTARAKNTSNSNDDDGDNYVTKTSSVSATPSPAKKAALDGVLQRIERNYGRGSVVKLGDADRMIVDCVGSGSLTLGECESYFWN